MDKQYSIREVSAKFNLPASTLRYYEEVGILTDIPRNSSGKRIYLEKHINRLKTICCFKNTGMSIAQLQEFFQYEQQEPSHIDDILKLLTNQKNHILAKKISLLSSYENSCG